MNQSRAENKLAASPEHDINESDSELSASDEDSHENFDELSFLQNCY